MAGTFDKKREVQDRVRAVAREVVAEFGLTDAFAVTDTHINAAYIKLWDWDKLSVEMLTDHERVRHAIEMAVADAHPSAAATGEEPF